MTRLLIIPLFILSCTTIEEVETRFSFNPLSKDRVKVVTIEKELERYKLVLSLKGQLDKPGSIIISNSERVISTYFLPKGEVDRVIRSDWYDNHCKIEFRSREENGGFLNFQANFL